MKNDTMHSNKSEHKQQKHIKTKQNDGQGMDVNTYDIEKDNVRSKIRSLSNKQVSIKVMKMLQHKA